MEHKKERLITPVLGWFMFAMVLANISAEMSFLLFALYLADLGADVQQIGLVFSIVGVVSLVLQVFGGWVSDSIGRLKAVAIGSVGGVVGVFAVALAPSWQWFVLAMILSQFPRALIGPSFGAFIAENSKEENRGKVYGITDMIFTICGIVGPALGGLLSDQFGFSLVFWAAAVLYSMAAVVRIWMARTMKSAKVEQQKALTLHSFKLSIRTLVTMILGGGIITWIFITDGVRDAVYSLSRNLETLYLEQIIGLDTTQIGLLFSAFSIAMLATPLVAGRLGDKYGERLPISLGFLMIFGAYGLFLSSSSYMPFVLVWVIYGLGVGLLSPAYSSLISKVVPHDRLGTFNGVFYGAIGLLALPAPYLGSLMWDGISPKAPFFAAAAVSLLTIIPIWLKFKLPRGGEMETPSAVVDPMV
ncbi:MAG: MFS transporter [Anaerolineae bacterium]|nr:MFS transporter [Anaerolineae bacterium]